MDCHKIAQPACIAHTRINLLNLQTHCISARPALAVFQYRLTQLQRLGMVQLPDGNFLVHLDLPPPAQPDAPPAPPSAPAPPASAPPPGSEDGSKQPAQPNPAAAEPGPPPRQGDLGGGGADAGAQSTPVSPGTYFEWAAAQAAGAGHGLPPGFMADQLQLQVSQSGNVSNLIGVEPGNRSAHFVHDAD